MHAQCRYDNHPDIRKCDKSLKCRLGIAQRQPRVAIIEGNLGGNCEEDIEPTRDCPQTEENTTPTQREHRVESRGDLIEAYELGDGVQELGYGDDAGPAKKYDATVSQH